jgi:hypothetical protein
MHASGGEGLKQDLRQAFVWCQKAADLDFVPAQATLGVLYARTQNPERAMHWWTRAAAQGDPEAQYNLAVAHATGQGTGRSLETAFSWFLKAAAQGVPAAQGRLGLMYATGEGVAPDPIEAHAWFEVASAAGDAPARANCARSAARLTSAQLAEARRRAVSRSADSTAQL